MSNNGIYKNYEDWYDNGPGSEAFKRSSPPAPLKTFPDLSPKTEGPTMPPERVLTEESYRSQPRVNQDDDMMRITINLPILQWKAFRHKFLRLLHRVRLGGL